MEAFGQWGIAEDVLAVAFPMLEEKIVHSVAEEAAFLVTVETALSEAALLVTVEIAHLAAVLASSHRAVQVVAVQAARLYNVRSSPVFESPGTCRSG